MRNRRKRNARRAALTTFFVFTKKVSCAIRALPRYPGRGYRPLHPRYATTAHPAKLCLLWWRLPTIICCRCQQVMMGVCVVMCFGMSLPYRNITTLLCSRSW